MSSIAARRSGLRGAGFHLVMAPITLIYISPMVFVILISLRSFNDIVARGVTALPKTLSVEGYRIAWSSGVRQALINSALVTVSAVVLSLWLASMAAFALSRYRIPYARAILMVMLAGNLLPPQILLIPVAQITQLMGIYDSLTALVVVQVGFGLGFYTFVLHGFMRSIPSEIFEAAKIDAAGVWRTYTRIVLPLSRPSLAALAALAFTWVFNDLLWAMTVLRSEVKFPISAALLNLSGGFVSQWDVVAAGSLIGALPPAVMFFAFQKHFVSGLLVGSNK